MMYETGCVDPAGTGCRLFLRLCVGFAAVQKKVHHVQIAFPD